jgi:hypothetical protein
MLVDAYRWLYGMMRCARIWTADGILSDVSQTTSVACYRFRLIFPNCLMLGMHDPSLVLVDPRKVPCSSPHNTKTSVNFSSLHHELIEMICISGVEYFAGEVLILPCPIR